MEEEGKSCNINVDDMNIINKNNNLKSIKLRSKKSKNKSYIHMNNINIVNSQPIHHHMNKIKSKISIISEKDNINNNVISDLVITFINIIIDIILVQLVIMIANNI